MHRPCRELNAEAIRHWLWLSLQVRTSNKFMQGMLVILGLCTLTLGPLAMFNLYFMPYWINVVWLDIVTYLHHHGAEDPKEKVPWYRGQVTPLKLSAHACMMS